VASSCMIVGTVLGKGKGLSYCFNIEDEVEICKLMVFEESDDVEKRCMESCEVV